ncbi:MAG: hypothetical protein CEN90_59 [Parcubacteria group bacterium Licking1014_17]|nr:MAG: hypothetical protein CEN90_59 [Parcubacteria group bacterium Licking1014_17]
MSKKPSFFSASAELKVVVFVAVFVFFSWIFIDNRIYFNFFKSLDANAATSGTASQNMSIDVGVGLTFVKYSSVAWRNDSETPTSTITSGTPLHSTQALQVTTNDNYTISVGRKRQSPNTTLASASDVTIHIEDASTGIDVFNGLANCTTATSTTAYWPVTGAVSVGIGFSNWKTQIAGDKSSCWGTGTVDNESTPSTNRYAALQASASASTFLSTTNHPLGVSYFSVVYRLDVTASQRATNYSGTVNYTATTQP